MRCLRFDQIIGNQGAGPFELRYQIPSDNLLTFPTKPPVYQRIYSSDRTFTDRKAADFEYHPTHAHFHYEQFAQSFLYASDVNGSMRATTPEAEGKKNGFCMIDVENWWFGRKGDAARSYRFPGCMVAPGQEMVNGISVGWADIYNWYLPDQYIEVSGLSGYYLLQTVVDPKNTVVEAEESNNCISVLIHISETSARFAGSGEAC